MPPSPAGQAVANNATPPALPERYLVRGRAGSGTFGTVWEAADSWHRADRAIKVLGPDRPSPEWQERFYHEFALLYRLAHPALVRAHDFGRLQDGTPYFTMDWVGTPVLETGTWSEEQKLRILWELLDVLTYVHRQGIIHADIKASNIKIDRAELDRPLSASGRRAITLLDFGLTLDLRVQAQESRRGTVQYMAPEWFKEGAIDFRIDHYSLGVLLYELWSGCLPFDGSEPLAVIRQHLETPPPDLSKVAPGVPVQISEGIARLLAKQPEIRDKGWGILKQYVGLRLKAEPGEGVAALPHHRWSLGSYREQIPDEVVQSWLGAEHRPLPLFLRGGVGLDQHEILKSLWPDVCRFGFVPWLVEDIDSPLPPGDWSEVPLLPLLAVDPTQSEAYQAFLNRWTEEGAQPRRIAVSVSADDGRNRRLVTHLADATRAGACRLYPVRCLDADLAERRIRQVLPASTPPAEVGRLLGTACGNSARLWALLEDYLEHQENGTAPPTVPSGHYQRQIEREENNLRATYSAEELAAISLVASARVPVDREALRSLADTNWTRALSSWLDFGLVEGEAGTFRWTRPDVAVTVRNALPESRRKIIHRAWAEYWGSRSPEAGTAEHEHQVYHLLRSDAYRQATRVGLESARYCTSQHQAQKALDILNGVAEAMAHVPHPAPSLSFELAIAHAEARRVLARYGEALEHLDKALALESIKGNVRWEAEIYKRKGDLCKSLKQSAAGKVALEEALKRFRDLGDRAEVSHVLNNIGNIHFVAGEFDLAIQSYEDALALQRELGLRREVASTLNNIGGILILKSRYEVATQHLTEAVRIKRTLSDPEELARSLNNLAVAHVETGKFGLALDVLKESYRINVEAGKTGEQLFNLENLAGVCLARGEWAEAMSHCERGMKLCDMAGEPEGRLPYLLVMSGVSLAQGNYDLIGSTLGEALRMIPRVEDADLQLSCRLFEAERAYWLNQPDIAGRKASEVMAQAEAEQLPAWSTRGYLLKARIESEGNEHPESVRPWVEEALRQAESTGALPEQIHARTLLAGLEVQDNRLEQAADHLRRCEQFLLECSARPLFLPFSYALGRYYEKRGEREMALSALDTARKLATNLTQLEWLWRFHALCGHQLLAMKRFDGAVDQYRSGLILLEHLVGRIPQVERERYMQGREKIAMAEGLRSCHEALVR